jgi:hypothetical protein
MADKHEQIILRGIDTPERLLEWCRAKKHKNLVLRTADIFELAPLDQEALAELLQKAYHPAPAGGQTLRLWYQGLGRHVVTPIAALLERLDMADLSRLQEILSYYVEGRRMKGEPSKTEDCDCTDGGKTSPRPDCRLCEGRGRLHVLLEVTDEELRLAEGK